MNKLMKIGGKYIILRLRYLIEQLKNDTELKLILHPRQPEGEDLGEGLPGWYLKKVEA